MFYQRSLPFEAGGLRGAVSPPAGPVRPKNHPVHPCNEYKVRRKTHQVQEPMKNGKFAQHIFITLGKLKLQMNLQISLNAQLPMPKNKSTRDFFPEHLNSET